MSEFSYRLSYGATAPKPYGSILPELLNTSNEPARPPNLISAYNEVRAEVTRMWTGTERGYWIQEGGDGARYYYYY